MFSALEVLENRYVTAFIPNPLLDKKHHICNRRRIKTQFRSCYELLKVIGEELIRLSALGMTVVFFIAEAQAITEESLEAIRLLTAIKKDSDGHIPL